MTDMEQQQKEVRKKALKLLDSRIAVFGASVALDGLVTILA